MVETRNFFALTHEPKVYTNPARADEQAHPGLLCTGSNQYIRDERVLVDFIFGFIELN